MAKIKVEKELYQRAVQLAGEMGYSSVDEFVGHLIEQALAQQQSQEEEDEAKVEDRLRGLGYLD